METNKINWKWLLVVAIAFLVIGFFAGRSNSDVITKTVNVPGKTIHDTVYADQITPINSEIPDSPNLPMKPETIKVKHDSIVYKKVYMTVDTAKIIQNYITKNSYRKQLFNNENGKLTVSADVQYNLLQKLSYDFTPMQKVTTVEKKRIFTPFLTGSYNSLGYWGAGGGIYYYDIGVSAKYVTDFKQSGYEIGLNVKF